MYYVLRYDIPVYVYDCYYAINPLASENSRKTFSTAVTLSRIERKSAFVTDIAGGGGGGSGEKVIRPRGAERKGEGVLGKLLTGREREGERKEKIAAQRRGKEGWRKTISSRGAGGSAKIDENRELAFSFFVIFGKLSVPKSGAFFS